MRNPISKGKIMAIQLWLLGWSTVYSNSLRLTRARDGLEEKMSLSDSNNSFPKFYSYHNTYLYPHGSSLITAMKNYRKMFLI